jgi:hypothetical protein
LRLDLEPGTYRVVSWANHGDNVTMNNHETAHIDDGTTAHLTYGSINGGMVGGGDALYYAPAAPVGTRAVDSGAGHYYTMHVDSATGHEGTLDFRHAHRRIEVYVNGFPGGRMPIIELTGLPSAIKFLGMDAHDAGHGTVTARVGAQPTTFTANGKQETYALSAFHAFYLHLED